MGMFSKLAFWKKDDDFGFDDKPIGGTDPFAKSAAPAPGLDEKSPFGDPATPMSSPMSTPSAPPFGSTPPAPNAFAAQKEATPTSGSNRDIELISSKLDTIKAVLNSMDQRIANIERIAGAEQQQQPQQRLW